MLTFRKSRTHARVETHEDTNHQLIVEALSQIRGLYPVDVAGRVLSLARHGGFVPLEEVTIRETMMVTSILVFWLGFGAFPTVVIN